MVYSMIYNKHLGFLKKCCIIYTLFYNLCTAFLITEVNHFQAISCTKVKINEKQNMQHNCGFTIIKMTLKYLMCLNKLMPSYIIFKKDGNYSFFLNDEYNKTFEEFKVVLSLLICG
ncbi:hypothetical protein QTP88_018020 [Uroleucon formosanum]